MDLEFQSLTEQFIFKATHPDHKINSNNKNTFHIRDPETVTKKWMEEMDYTEIANIQRLVLLRNRRRNLDTHIKVFREKVVRVHL